MALIMFAELLTVKPEADQLSLCALLATGERGALITGGWGGVEVVVVVGE